MIDWTDSMQRTYEYYIVDPETWKDTKLLTTVKACTINRDSKAETLGSAAINITDSLGECYIRVYMIVIQNGVKEKIPLGTFLVQTPNSSFDGRIRNVTMDAYTPLLELKEKQPPIGYFIPKDENVMDYAYRLTRENVRAPVVRTENSTNNVQDFVADTSDTWLSYLSDFIANQLYNINVNGISKAAVTKYKYSLDEMGRILFSPEQDTASLQPVWTYDDGNSSILYPELSMEHDLYGIPNVVEVLYSNGRDYYHVEAVNDNENSPVSTVNRGRKIIYRVTDPDLVGDPTEEHLQEYADQLLDALSSPEYTITYTHGYCPVRVGDCVRLNYSRAGLTNIKAKVISQNIKCTPDCPVTEKAVFTTNLWR